MIYDSSVESFFRGRYSGTRQIDDARSLSLNLRKMRGDLVVLGIHAEFRFLRGERKDFARIYLEARDRLVEIVKSASPRIDCLYMMGPPKAVQPIVMMR